jgi:predicted dehydrogenase
MIEAAPQRPPRSDRPGRPRLGFAGVGWIGRSRLEAIAAAEVADIAAIADTTPTALIAAAAHAPDAAAVATFDELLALDLDGVVIATPNALHATQTIAALRAGCAVFCQKPLARNAAETQLVLDAAATADRLLGVDLSYRHTAGMQAIKRLIATGALGDIYAIELVFHNAYGPDKPWFYDRTMAGGGCLLDLGVHLLDLALWCLDFPAVTHATGQLLAKGRPWRDGDEVEDYAAGQLATRTGTSIQLTCSWHAPAGCDAHIGATFFGTKGGASFRNVDGSFLDFVAEHFLPDRSRRPLAAPPEEWGGRAAVAWAQQLAARRAFDPAAMHLQLVADVLDRLYGRDL